MGFFSSGGTDIKQISTQTGQQKAATELMLAKALESIRGFRPDPHSRVRKPSATEQNIFAQAGQRATAQGQRGGPQPRGQRPQGGGQPTGRAALEAGPQKRTLDTKSEIAQGLHSLIGKVLKNT